MYIINALVYTDRQEFAPLTVRTRGEQIIALLPPDAALESGEEIVDASGCYCIPGLTDIHFHGCNGYDFCDGTAKAYQAMADFELEHGVTSMCPATMTLPADTLTHICKEAADFARRQTSGADLIGIHMEGPFINPVKKGAQNAAYIQKPDASLIRRWLNDSGHLVRLITLAPEIDGAIDCIRECREEIAFSIGHTNANYDTAMSALHAGADHITHLYNAMPPFHHRESGVIGAAYDTPDCYKELICDGIHVSAPVVRATFALCPDHVILISDSMRATGMPDGSYTLGGQDVTVHGKLALLFDGTIAGSATPLLECMKTAISMGISLEQAIAAATILPCRSIGIDDCYGSITPGKKAHFNLLDIHSLSLKKVIKDSKIPLLS